MRPFQIAFKCGRLSLLLRVVPGYDPLSEHFLSHGYAKEYQTATLNFMIFSNFTGHELLVWYGDDYASDLGIEKENYCASVIPGA